MAVKFTSVAYYILQATKKKTTREKTDNARKNDNKNKGHKKKLMNE